MKFPTGRFQHFENQSFLQGDKYDHENMKAMMMGIIKHSQSTQSNKFAISLQYFQKKLEWSYRSKHLQVELLFFNESSQTCPKYPKKGVC